VDPAVLDPLQPSGARGVAAGHTPHVDGDVVGFDRLADARAGHLVEAQAPVARPHGDEHDGVPVEAGRRALEALGGQPEGAGDRPADRSR
jgi:hypothetical protein